MKFGWLKNILIGFLKEELAKLAEEQAAKLRHAENTSVRDLLQRRRAEFSGLPPVEAINRLVDKVEKTETKANRYADIVWRHASGMDPAAVESLQAEARAIENG